MLAHLLIFWCIQVRHGSGFLDVRHDTCGGLFPFLCSDLCILFDDVEFISDELKFSCIIFSSLLFLLLCCWAETAAIPLPAKPCSDVGPEALDGKCHDDKESDDASQPNEERYGA